MNGLRTDKTKSTPVCVIASVIVSSSGTVNTETPAAFPFSGDEGGVNQYVS